MYIPHITIYTAKMEESIAFYQDTARLHIVADQRPRAPIVFLANGEGETRVELIEDPQSAYHGGGIAIGFATDDVEADRERLAHLDPTPFMCPGPNVKFFFVKDPNGVTVQLIQH